MIAINTSIRSVTAFAPATCANVAVGFDILGFSFAEVGDVVTLTRREDRAIKILSIDSVEPLPFDANINTASVVVQKVCQDLKLEVGFSIHIKKGIPLSSGMGGSAASAVAALTALNAFFMPPLSLDELVQYALVGEEVASGQGHADNVVPCMYGGLTLIHSHRPMGIIQLPIPELYCVLIHPHIHVATKQARSILKDQVPLKDYINQSGHLAAFIAALYERDMDLLKKSLVDLLIEPQRAAFVPGFYEVKDRALQTGALGVSFSGSGPSLFAWAKDRNDAQFISDAMQEPLKHRSIDSDCWITSMGGKSAHVTEIK